MQAIPSVQDLHTAVASYAQLLASKGPGSPHIASPPLDSSACGASVSVLNATVDATGKEAASNGAGGGLAEEGCSDRGLAGLNSDKPLLEQVRGGRRLVRA